MTKCKKTGWKLINKKTQLTVCYLMSRTSFQSESTRYSLPECQGTPYSKQAPNLKFKWQQRDSNPQPLSSYTKTESWSVWLNGWVFVYELSGCGFESRCCHLKKHFSGHFSREFLQPLFFKLYMTSNISRFYKMSLKTERGCNNIKASGQYTGSIYILCI